MARHRRSLKWLCICGSAVAVAALVPTCVTAIAGAACAIEDAPVAVGATEAAGIAIGVESGAAFTAAFEYYATLMQKQDG